MARIQVSNDPSGRIIVSFPYDPLLVEKVRTIDGRRWHPTEKHWSFLKLEGMLEKILKVFGDENIQIDPSLQANLPKTSSREDEAKQELSQFEDLRRELVSRKYSYTPHFCISAGFYNKDLIRYAAKNPSDILGHQRSKTTEIYTHVNTKSIGKIKSPLDNLNLKRGGDV